MSGLFTVSMNRPAGRSRKSVMSYDGNESSVLTGTVSESIGYSTGSSSTALAADRWSVEKRRQEWDREMQAFRHREQSRMKFLQLTSGQSYLTTLYHITLTNLMRMQITGP